jgi:hypothetical protein
MQEPDACLEDVEDIDASNLLEIEEEEMTLVCSDQVFSYRLGVSKAM